jgi:hypothetical protein
MVCPKEGDVHIVFNEGTPEPHSFYHRLLQWDMSLIAPQVTPIAAAIMSGDLHVCADGAYMPDLQQGAHAWVFATTDQTILWKNVGPSPGFPISMTPYRAELCGLVSTLFTIHWVCRSANISHGHVTIYCDNESALRQMFTPTRPTNNPYKSLKADIDLLTCGRDLLLQLPIEVTLTHEWVKGHFTGKRRLLQHNLNDIADCLAREFNSTPRTPCTGTPAICPTSEAELIYKNCVVTSRLLQLVKSSLHDTPLKEYIIQRAKWNSGLFDKVNWAAHTAAFHQHSRLQRLSITKLVHGLYHTNSEAHKLYGSPATCPCCLKHKETLSHVLICTANLPINNRRQALASFQATLHSIKTPKKLTQVLLHGLSEFEQSQYKPDFVFQPLFRGSILSEDCHLVQAYQEQTALGWDQFLRGRISLKWNCAFLAGSNIKCGTTNEASRWAVKVIKALWTYSTALWKFRNSVVYGATKEDAKAKELEHLHQRVRHEYHLFSNDPFLVSPQFASLFSKKSLQERLRMDIDSMTCWLRSVEEAKHHQANFRASLSKLSSRFFLNQSNASPVMLHPFPPRKSRIDNLQLTIL